MHRKQFLRLSCAAGFLAWVAPAHLAGQPFPWGAASWQDLFLHPPADTYPQLFWFWMNGHISRDGITADLEAMKAAGISGVFQYDAGTGIPKGPVAYGSEAYWELKKHALSEALRLDLECTLHNCPGWSASGGPWITPENSMQELTWSEWVVTGGEPISMVLPKPNHKLDYYRDVALLAFPASAKEAALSDYLPTTTVGRVDKASINGNGAVLLDIPDAQGYWLLFAFTTEVTASNITLQVAATRKGEAEQLFDGERNFLDLEASQDGIRYALVARISTGLEAALLQGFKFITFDFAVTHARYFRISSRLPRRLAQVRFSALQRLPDFMEQAGYRFGFEKTTVPAASLPGMERIPKDTIIDLTRFMDASGRLRWEAPAGHYTLLRVGHTSTGATNKAAPEGGQGLECDKMRSEAVELHLAHAVGPILPQLALLAQKGKAGLEIDSFEAGMQNWTAGMPQLFFKTCNYNILPYLPTLTGRVVNSVEETQQFLWDFRQTIAEAVAENYYGAFAAWCRQKGLTSYVEPYDKGPFNELAIGSKADVPMGEHWNGLFAILQGNLPIRRTPRLAASIAHALGKKAAGAETFTAEPGAGKWQEYPFGLKATGDALFIQGVNKMILHRFVHQPNPFVAPGMTMGPWGSHIDRTNTWWPLAKPWFTYLARCQMLLRQGDFVADIAYLAPEESATFTPVQPEELIAPPPKGYAYDLLSAAVIRKQARVADACLVLNSGMRYRVLVIQDPSAISFPTLAALVTLVRQGMVLVSLPVLHCLGIQTPAAQKQCSAWTKELWGDGKMGATQRVGKGLVIANLDLGRVLRQIQVAPDCIITAQSGDAPISFLHRQTATEDIYFLCNARRTTEELVVSFRVKGRHPRLMHPVHGKIQSAPITTVLADRVQVRLQMEPCGALFVVFGSSKLTHYSTVKKDGKILLSSSLFPFRQVPQAWAVSNNFTFHCRIKPEQDIMLRFSEHMERVKAPYTDFYAIYPASGNAVFEPGHAICGIAVGRNGVTVWENASGTPERVLAVVAPVSGWTHLALVYRQGQPAVYLDGVLKGKGAVSKWSIHPGTGRGVQESTDTYYNGDIMAQEMLPVALDAAAVLALSQQLEKDQKTVPPILLHEGLMGGILVSSKGSYQLIRQKGAPLTIQVPSLPAAMPVGNSWQVDLDAPATNLTSISLATLQSLHTLPEARHFSGTAVYTTHFNMPGKLSDPSVQWLLDLGRVEVIAEVVLNGVNLGVVWARPYRIQATGALKAGANKLEVRVTNLWPNRLIGDAAQYPEGTFTPGATDGSFEALVGGGIREVPAWYIAGEKPPKGQERFTSWRFYQKQDPLLESGLLGPVVIQPYYEIGIAPGK